MISREFKYQLKEEKTEVVMSNPTYPKVIAKMLCTICIAFLLTISLQAQEIACNKSVQISVNAECEVNVSPDMILEGEYNDYDRFAVNVEGFDGSVVTATGQYTVTVLDKVSLNSCWGTISVEDKLGPQVFCQPVYLPCASPTLPGAKIHKRVRSQGHMQNYYNDTMYIHFEFAPQIPYGATIYDIELDLNLYHKDITEMQAYLVSPKGKRRMMFDRPQKDNKDEACGKESMMVYMKDAAYKGYHMMNEKEECKGHSKPSIHGEYKPHDPFEGYHGDEAGGTWKLLIVDMNKNEHHPELLYAKLRLGIYDGHVGVPFYGDVEIEEIAPHRIRVKGGAVCGEVIAEYSDDYDTECHEDGKYYGKINRTWIIEDIAGNVNSCVQDIYFTSTPFDYIDFPYDYDGDKLPTYKCDSDFEGKYDDYGHPHPDLTGWPVDWGNHIGSACKNIQISYKDVKIDICHNSYKLLRTWTLINWCVVSPSNTMDYLQTIVVKDDVAPKIKCPDHQYLIAELTNSHDCTVDLDVPAPKVLYECSDYTWTVQYKVNEDYEDCAKADPKALYSSVNVINHADGKVTIKDLPLGCIWLKYIVTDDCGNKSEAYCELKVLDKTPPVAVCEEETVISLGSDGYAKVFAETFDDLSSDNCSETLEYKVRKMTNVCDTSYYYHTDKPHDYVVFCCEEVGTTIQVELTIIDHYGNKNTCMIDATIQDKSKPHIHCPGPVEVDCHTSYAELSDDKYGAPTAGDNCGGVTIHYAEITDSLDQCGVGYIYKTWKVTSDVDTSLFDKCTQHIKLINKDYIKQAHIYFPYDTILVGCAADTKAELLGEPKIHKQGCGLVAVNYEDTRFTLVDDACEKIIREWTVIDWCQYNPSYNVYDGYWTYNQNIKIQNVENPVITTGCEHIEYCSYEANCISSVTLTAAAMDDCTTTEGLKWEYAIDYFNDGTVDLRSNDVSFRSDSVLVTLDSVAQDTTHSIKWIVSDGCQNYDYCSYTFKIKDCKAPTPICLSDIVTTVMPSNGEIMIWARDFDHKSEDNCSPYDSLQFSFSEDVTDVSRTYVCADISNGVAQRGALTIWVTDTYGNQDFCVVTIEIQDNANVCPDAAGGLSAMVAGSIKTESGVALDNVTVEVDGDAPELPWTINTAVNGAYSFENLPGGTHYNLRSSKSDILISGLSTIDIVLMQQHILGHAPLESPYQIIAADADNNSKVSSTDLILLRRVLLGLLDELPNGQQPWRFVDQSASFVNPAKPFPFKEEILIQNLVSDMLTADFMGIKIGDVNGSFSNSLKKPELRTNDALVLKIQDEELNKGEQKRIMVRAGNQFNLIGLQKSLNVNTDLITVSNISSPLSNMSDHFAHSNTGVNMVWHLENATPITTDDIIYIVDIEVLQSTLLSDAISVQRDGAGLSPEAYSEQFDLNGIELVFDGELNETGINLFQNQPNPFEDRTTISFSIPKDMSVSFTIHDASGKQVYEDVSNYSAGTNQINISNNDIKAEGIYYYSISTSHGSITKKMIHLGK